MDKSTKMPFRQITLEYLTRLLLVATVAFYGVQIAFFIFQGQICDDFGFDYCAYWSIGKIMRTNGFSNAYNMDVITKLQETIYPQAKNPSLNFTPPFAPYIPIFMMPFYGLSFLNLTTSYILWIIINLISFILYMKFFIKEINPNFIKSDQFLIILLALPVFINFQEGQLNVLLAISAGEFIRGITSNKPFRAGLWLGGWLLKPQLLILILPFLIIQQLCKALKGFLLASFLLGGLSLLVIGSNGVQDMAKIFFDLGSGGLGSNPYVMMNWRMVDTHIASFTSPTVGFIVTVIGTLITLFIVIFAFRNRINPSSNHFIISLLAIFAATCAVTWHAHLHMSIILIPPILYLILKENFNKRLLTAWIFMPVLVLFGGYLVIILVSLSKTPIPINQIIFFSKGFSIFSLNLLLIVWAKNQFSQTNDQSPSILSSV